MHSRDALADPELLPSVREEAQQVLLEKGVQLFLGNLYDSIDLARMQYTP